MLTVAGDLESEVAGTLQWATLTQLNPIYSSVHRTESREDCWDPTCVVKRGTLVMAEVVLTNKPTCLTVEENNCILGTIP